MEDIIKALTQLFSAIVKVYGSTGTVIIFVVIVLLFSAIRLYTDYRKDKELNLVLAEKEKSIQRLAKECREWRVLFFKDKFGWDDQQLEKFIQNVEYSNPKEARDALEKGDKRNGQ